MCADHVDDRLVGKSSDFKVIAAEPAAEPAAEMEQVVVRKGVVVSVDGAVDGVSGVAGVYYILSM